jgi:hypothetical protein
MVTSVTTPDRAPRDTAAMGVNEAVHISAGERRWLTIVCCLLVGLSLLPLFLAALAAGGDWVFMGFSHNIQDAATYLSKMRLGYEGGWLLQFLHTPETHDGALTFTFYLFLGHLARFTGLDLVVVFHLARVIGTLVMYTSLYVLAAVLWTHVTTRRLFFVIAAVGSGFGWLAAPLTGQFTFPDLAIPEMFPFYSSLMNPHFPLTIGLLALLLAQFVRVFRHDGNANWHWPALRTAALASGLTLLYPQSLVPFAGAIVVYLVNLRWKRGALPRAALAHTAALVVPAVPMALYLVLVLQQIPAFTEWNRQNQTLSPPLWIMVLGLGLPLLIGIPAVIRAARRFDRDGDRLMLWWLLAIAVLMFAPTNIQRRFGVGLMIPVAFFATLALRDYWLPKLNQRAGRLLVAAALVVMPLSTVLVTFVTVLPLLLGAPEDRPGMVLPAGYPAAMEWLDSQGEARAVALAAPDVSLWIPGTSGLRVVYGHPFETLNAETKQAQVTAWYGLGPDDACEALLDAYGVRYVIFGPLEQALGAGDCVRERQPAASFGDVRIYVVG